MWIDGFAIVVLLVLAWKVMGELEKLERRVTELEKHEL